MNHPLRGCWLSRLATVLALLATLMVLSPALLAQSLLAGDITGTVTDPSGAIVPNATVNLKSVDTGTTQSTTTNASGFYRFALLKPGRYQVTMNQSGFQPIQSNVIVAVGQATTNNITLAVSTSVQTVEVTAETPVLNAESASLNTSFSQLEVSALPNGGQDLTNIAQTTPGTVMNVSGGYGNFTNNGLPATSNLFTVNGENDMDPYFNINNSGATNLTLGANEIQEATVVTNPYGGQYGQLSGAQVTFLTKSGTNQFHGNAQYWWNGRVLNANDWFANYDGTPRPFANNNQYAASFGGPIFKDKTFFFVDYEGLRYVLPTVQVTDVVTPAFANASLAYISANHPAELPVFQKLYNYELTAPGVGSAQPISGGGCGTVSAATLPGFAGGPCIQEFTATPNAKSNEYILAGRLDQNIGNSDKAYFRYRADRGLQATSTDPINAVFNAFSNQPADDGQFQETHVFSPNATNEFVATLSYYSAIFTQNDAAIQASGLPYRFTFSNPVNLTSFNPMSSFPQGRNITQYQFIDDFTLNRGNHNMNFGVNFRRYDISDHNFFYNYPRVYFGSGVTSMLQFAQGLAYQYRLHYNASQDVPIALWGAGWYAQDEWRVMPNLKLTLAMRIEHNSNPVCQINCFANFAQDWGKMPHGNTVPYNSVIQSGLHNAYQGVDGALYSPRFGFVWSPRSSTKTVVSGGFGLFYDNAPAGLVDDLLADPPIAVNFNIRNPGGSKLGVLPFDPAGAPAAFQASQAGFVNGFASGGSFKTIKAAVPAFAPPSFTSIIGTVHSPRVEEWNFQIQRELTGNMVLLANYSGNHAMRIPYANPWPNASDAFGEGGGVPATAADPSYGAVSQVQNGAWSNYNGLSVSLRRSFGRGVSGGLNYTWSHALDTVSNGGIFIYGGDSILGQIAPSCFRCDNYGNADYDVRHYLSAYYVYEPTWKFGNGFMNQVLGGWQWSGKVFWRTGLPFTVTDNNAAYSNGGLSIPGQPLAFNGPTPGQTGSCSAHNASDVGSAPTCLDASAFVDSSAA
ncbi:MAG: TonB-dependent receptor, partial [Acidobacteria bacterium]|nr:TonB-dependent receptor [Acidobacteriota bacterium]